MLQPIYDFLSTIIPPWSDFFYNAFMVPIKDFAADVPVLSDLWSQVTELWGIADLPIVYVIVVEVIKFYIIYCVIMFLIPLLK